jgi:hypothetical protein
MYEMPTDDRRDDAPVKPDWFTLILIMIAGADWKILTAQCPEDIGKIKAIALLPVSVFMLTSAILTLVTNSLFGEPGHFSFGLMAGSVGFAFVILLCDSYVFLRCSWIQAGLDELGIPLPRGQRAKVIFFLANRILLAVCWAYVIGTCFALLVYGKDIATRIETDYLRQNAAIVAQVSLPIDAQIRSADEAVRMQIAGISALSKQVSALRQTEAYRFRVGRKGKLDPEFDNGVRSFESRLSDENARLANLKLQAARLVQDRNAAIRKAVDSAPNHVPYNDGFLARLKVLGQIASEDWKVALLIFALESVCVGTELAPILAKLFGYNPTVYSVIVGREFVTRVSQISDEMTRELEVDAVTLSGFPTGRPANDNDPRHDGGTPTNDNVAPEQPVKRKRGRPPKYPPPAINGSGLPEK